MLFSVLCGETTLIKESQWPNLTLCSVCWCWACECNLLMLCWKTPACHLQLSGNVLVFLLQAVWLICCDQLPHVQTEKSLCGCELMHLLTLSFQELLTDGINRSCVSWSAFLVLTLSCREGWLALFMCKADAVGQSNGIMRKPCIPCLGVRSLTACMEAPQLTENIVSRPVSFQLGLHNIWNLSSTRYRHDQ